MVLLPKKEGASLAQEYMLVSLMHNHSKILCKLLANRLASELPKLVWHHGHDYISLDRLPDRQMVHQET